MSQPALAISPAITIVDGVPTTLSTDLASHFGKRHDDILRAIRNLLPQLDADHARNLAEMVIEVEISGARNFAETSRKSPAYRLTRVMAAYPEFVAGEGRACTELMRAMGGKVAIKTGAEAVFVAILPAQKLGIALKIVDGASRASEAAIAGLLVRLGVLDAQHPATLKRLNAVQRNWRGLETGITRLAPGFA